MYVYPVAIGLLLHTLFWGAGFAWLIVPPRHRRFWPVLAAPSGFLLQSLVVWLGAYLDLRGTQVYAWWSELLPLALWVLVLARSGVARVAVDVARLWGVWLASLASLGALLVPYARSYHGLSTSSLGSCDAADYAAGARVFMEFARTDRTGFIGLSEVTHVMSVDNFYDFWLKLNHFTPSALIALNGTIFDCSPHEITGLMGMVFLAASVPTVFWLSRVVMRFRPVPSVLVSLLYGVSPITWYAVYHVAMGQLLAAQAIALASWAGIALWRGRLGTRSGLSYCGVLFLAYGLILGSYNFIILVALVPAVAFAGGLAIWKDDWLRFLRWSTWMILPFAFAAVVFVTRVGGLWERFVLFRTYDFGWVIPILSPDGWFGIVNGPQMFAVSGVWHWVATSLLLAGVVTAMVAGAQERRESVYVAVCLTVPALLGYGYLNLRGIQLGTNASYDAYKLFSVFYPGILPALCYWFAARPARAKRWAILPWVLAAVVVVGVGQADLRFQERMATPPLTVAKDVAMIQRIETMPSVSSVNMMVPDMWSRLWANMFLLRVPQYFQTHSYEGRLNTPLRGLWDLNGGILGISLPDGDSFKVSPNYSMVKTTSAYFVRAWLDEGWHDLERLPKSGMHWKWTKGDASLRISNPQKRPLRIVCKFTARSLDRRDLQLWVGDKRLRTVMIDTELKVVRVPEISVYPGNTVIRLRSSVPPVMSPGKDGRPLGFAAYGIEIQVLPDRDEPSGGLLSSQDIPRDPRATEGIGLPNPS